MNPKWQLCGRIPPGGTVLHIASAGDGTLWAASPAGLFARREGNWRAVTRGFPFGGASTILSIQNSIFVAGLPHGLVRSPDQGKTWHTCWIEQTDAPITCLVPSPNFNRDRVVLAGTDGDGILRSTDGGRFWRLENFGLRSFSVLSMATAPVWGRHEVLFAGTEAGLFQSPNGGRAWRQIGEELGDKKITALLVSPNFTEDMTIFAGTEEHGLFQSKDGGWHWTPFPLPPAHPKNINCLQLTGQDELLVGTGTDGILRAKTDGSSCKRVVQIASSVLCLAGSEDGFFAGLSEGGLLSSANGSETWTPDADLSARHFNWLAAAEENTLVAAGISEGLWISADAGAHWKQAATEHEDLTLLDLAVAHPNFWVGASNGVWVSRDVGTNWDHALPSDSPILAVASADSRVWAATESGQISASEDEGRSWRSLEVPIGTSDLVAFAVSPNFEEDQTLIAAAADKIKNRTQLWRSTDAGEAWHLWLDEKTDWQVVRLALTGQQAQETILAMGTKIMALAGGGWRKYEITTAQAPISALLTISEARLTLAAVADEMLASRDGVTWEVFSQGMEGASVIALQRSPGFRL